MAQSRKIRKRYGTVICDNLEVNDTFSYEFEEDTQIPLTATGATGSSPPTFAAFELDGTPSAGFALQTPGTSPNYISIPHNVVYNFTSDYTLIFWFKPDQMTFNNEFMVFKSNAFQIRATGVSSFRLRVQNENLFFNINPGVWNHIAVVHDVTAGELLIYVNATLQDSVVYGFTPAANTVSWVFGGNASGNSNRYVFGSFDEIKFFDTNYSSSDVSDDYNGGQGTAGTIATPNLVGGYHLDEGTGTIVTDYSSTGNNGSHVGSLTYIPGKVGSLVGVNGIFGWIFAQGVDSTLHFSFKPPKGYKNGSDITFRPNLTVIGTGTGNVVGEYVCSWTELDDPFTVTVQQVTIPVNSTVSTTYMIGNGVTLDGTGKTENSIIVGNFKRKGTSASDTLALPIAIMELTVTFTKDSITTE